MTRLVLLPVGAMAWDVSNPVLVILAGIAAAALVVYAYVPGLRKQPRFGRALLAGLRLAGVLLCTLALLHPAWIRRRDEERKPELAVILDNSLSMLQPAGQGEAATTRYGAAVRAIDGVLRPRLGSRFDIRCYDLRGGLLEGALPAAPELDSSPIDSAVANVRAAARGQPLHAVVLLSDGRRTDADDAVVRRELSGAPLFAVDVVGAGVAAGAGGTRDLAVQAVMGNSDAIVDNAVLATVLLSESAPGPEHLVELRMLDGHVPVARKMIRWGANEHDRTVEMSFVPRKPGRHVLSVQARRVDASGKPEGDEADLGNNWGDFAVEVRPAKRTVLLVDGVLRWESRYIREALDRDPDVNVMSAIRVAPPEMEPRSEGVFTKSQMVHLDLVILGDIEAGYFSTAELAELRRWVVEEGGGLLLTGGYRSFGPGGFGTPPIDGILPVVMPEGEKTQIESPFNMRLTDAGFRHPVLTITGDAVRDRGIWHGMPKLPGCSRIAGVKPGARVLAVNPEFRDSANPDGMPVMVEQQVGKGRVMVLAMDSTWQWRTYVGGYTGDSSFYQKFWSQMVRYLSPDWNGESRRTVHVGVPRQVCAPGETVEVFAELMAGAGDKKEGASVDEDYKVDGVAISEEGSHVQLALQEAGAGRFRAAFTPPRAGRWKVQVTAEPRVIGHGRVRDTRTTVVHVVMPDREKTETAPDRNYLERLAQGSGGQVLTLDELREWDPAARPVKVSETVTTEVWYHPWIVALLLGCVCTEWVLRRIGRLA